jgi:two-component system response regulator FlrC
MPKVLVVDDEVGIREFIGDALESDGYGVTDASNAPEAFHHLRSSRFDVLVTDLRMPGSFDGMELVRRARREIPDLEIIVLTAHGTVGTAVEAMKLGAFDFLQKPLSGPEELRNLVRRAVEHRRLTSLSQTKAESPGELPALTFGDPAMLAIVRSLEKVASTGTAVLLLGEGGTGKEIAARTVHQWSGREGPFMPVHCASISDPAMESELFGQQIGQQIGHPSGLPGGQPAGREMGSFSGPGTGRGAGAGGDAVRQGRLELAAGGTIFLDEVSELTPEIQAKLLRVIQDRSFQRVGGSRAISVDLRWIAATSRDLEAMVRSGAFREDLYRRLAVFPVRLPPLRDRRADLIPLAESLLARISASLDRPPLTLDEEAAAWIRTAHWPGNVRELANVLERAAILAEGDILSAGDLALPPSAAAAFPAVAAPVVEVRPTGEARTMADIEEEAIRQALAEVGGNRRRAAERLGIGVRTLYEKLKRYGIE